MILLGFQMKPYTKVQFILMYETTRLNYYERESIFFSCLFAFFPPFKPCIIVNQSDVRIMRRIF